MFRIKTATEILHVFGPKFWDLHYKMHPISDHVEKFHGDCLRELRDLVAKIHKNNICSKTCPLTGLIIIIKKKNNNNNNNNNNTENHVYGAVIIHCCA